MLERNKKYKLVGLELSDHIKLVSMGKLKQKGLAVCAYFSMGKCYYWVLRGQKV
tara:strand:- start:178 stop:339 length:162 start_codon:yes stop_codon:yes gene_type:complete